MINMNRYEEASKELISMMCATKDEFSVCIITSMIREVFRCDTIEDM